MKMTARGKQSLVLAGNGTSHQKR